MKKIIFKLLFIISAILVFNSIFLIRDCQSQWVWQNPLPQGNYLQSVKFINNNTGWTAGRAGTILKTTNAGTNWYFQISGITEDLHSISFVNYQTGWAVGSNAPPGYNNVNIIYRTTNGGNVFGNNISRKIPEIYYLSQNYPNPFNPATVIRFQLSVAGNASLKIFDMLGREIATLVNEKLNAGTYTVVWDGARFASGVYFYRLTAEGFGETKRMLLIK